jgi:hypothetical protein
MPVPLQFFICLTYTIMYALRPLGPAVRCIEGYWIFIWTRLPLELSPYPSIVSLTCGTRTRGLLQPLATVSPCGWRLLRAGCRPNSRRPGYALPPTPLLSPFHLLADPLSLGWVRVRRPGTRGALGSAAGTGGAHAASSLRDRAWAGGSSSAAPPSLADRARSRRIEQRRPSLPGGPPSSPCRQP